MSAFVVGLTGGIGSGKSAVAELFAAHGVEVVDTDAIAHQLTGPDGGAMPALEAEFGAAIRRPDGGLERAAMRRRVFADPAARSRLEGILHPLIGDVAASRCAAASSPYVILAVPLLIESGTYRRRCNRILVVDCDERLQVARVMRRSGLQEAEVRAIMAAQASRAERLAAADEVVSNDGGLAELAPQVERLHQLYAALSRGQAESQ